MNVYQGIVLHNGVVELFAFGCSSSQETRLADIHIELFQTPVPAATTGQGEMIRSKCFFISYRNEVSLSLIPLSCLLFVNHVVL